MCKDDYVSPTGGIPEEDALCMQGAPVQYFPGLESLGKEN